MKNIFLKITIMVITVLLTLSSAYAMELSGWFNINDSSSKTLEDGELTSETDTTYENLYFSINHSFTPMLSSRFNLRTNYIDIDYRGIEGEASKTYRRSIEPALDVTFKNPVFDVSTGYRRQEEWSRAHLNNDNRETTEFYYSRIHITPYELPSLNVQLDRQTNYDHMPIQETDSTDTSFSVRSAYDFPSTDLILRYTVNYSYSINKRPLDVTNKSIHKNLNGSYNMGYSGHFWGDNANYYLNYQGNYSRNKNTQYVSQDGTVLNERTPLGGFYAQGTTTQQDVSILSPKATLIDGDLNTTAGIDLSTDRYHNIGIMESSETSVDRLFIYVNKDIGTEAALNSMANWRVYKSNFNQAGTWSQVSIKSVSISVYDVINNIYRYEIEFLTSQNASFFKAINLAASTVTGLKVTEIEAYGTDIPENNMLKNLSTTFAQGLNFNTTIRPFPKWSFLLHYSLDRMDQNPISFADSFGGIMGNIFSDSVSDENSDFSSNITRNYGASSTWLTHRFLTTILRIQRNEAFDNNKETDVSSNTYYLSFNSAPLPTIDTTLSIIKSDSFSFNEKSSTNDSLLFSVGSKLYRDVNMITDLGYTRSESFTSDTTSLSRRINGSIDAVLTRKLSGTLNYGFGWTSSGGSSSRSKEASTIITYRPGKFINISGNLTGYDTDGDLTTSEGILIDWLPLRAIRLNVNYQHSDSEPDPVKTDTLGGYAIWYMTKFADVRFNYSYSKRKESVDTENYYFNTNVNCRF